MNLHFDLNAGSGMALGILTATLIALLVHGTTGDATVWSWIMPVGLAVGLAIGAAHERQKQEE